VLAAAVAEDVAGARRGAGLGGGGRPFLQVQLLEQNLCTTSSLQR